MAIKFNNLKDSIGKGFQKVKSGAKEVAGNASAIVKEKSKQVSEKVSDTAEKISENERVQNAKEKASDLFDDVKDKTKQIAEKVSDTAVKIANDDRVQNAIAKTSDAFRITKKKLAEASDAAKVKLAAFSKSVAETEAFKKTVLQYQRIRNNEKVDLVIDKTNGFIKVVGDKAGEIMADEHTQKILAATSQAVKKTGQISKKGLKVISGVQAVQDRKRSLQTREEADALKAEIEKTNEAIKDDLNDTLEEFGSYRTMALKNTVGLFLEYLERMNQKSKVKEYEFLKEIDLQHEELAEMKEVDMKASDAMKTLAVGAGFATVGLVGTPALVTGAVSALCAAGTGTAISSLSGAAATNAVLAWLGGGTIAAGGGGVAAGTAVMGALTATATAGLAVIAVGTLASAFYSKKATEATQYLADIKVWAAETEQSWVALDGIKARVLELQNLTEELEARTIVELADLAPLVDTFDPTDKAQVKEFQEAAIMVKSMSELAQTSVLDADGNINEKAKIVMAKTEKVINKEL